MQWPWGTSVPGAVPEPGCCCFGGTPYCPTVNTLFVRFSAGDALFSDEVLVRVQATSWFDVRGPPVPDTGRVASSAAFELRKYSVPPLLSSNELVPGDCAGQTVKPGWVAPASLGALTVPDVSICTIVTLAAPAASWAFEKA